MKICDSKDELYMYDLTLRCRPLINDLSPDLFYTTVVTSGAGTANPSGPLEFTSCLNGAIVCLFVYFTLSVIVLPVLTFHSFKVN